MWHHIRFTYPSALYNARWRGVFGQCRILIYVAMNNHHHQWTPSLVSIHCCSNDAKPLSLLLSISILVCASKSASATPYFLGHTNSPTWPANKVYLKILQRSTATWLRICYLSRSIPVPIHPSKKHIKKSWNTTDIHKLSWNPIKSHKYNEHAMNIYYYQLISFKFDGYFFNPVKI